MAGTGASWQVDARDAAVTDGSYLSVTPVCCELCYAVVVGHYVWTHPVRQICCKYSPFTVSKLLPDCVPALPRAGPTVTSRTMTCPYACLGLLLLGQTVASQVAGMVLCPG